MKSDPGFQGYGRC